MSQNLFGVAGIVGSIGTGVFVSASLGGVGVENYDMATQVWNQIVAVIIAVALGLIVMSTCAAPNTSTARRNTRNAPKRCTSFAPSITKPATIIEYATIPVATTVGATPKLSTMPRSATGSDATSFWVGMAV